MNQRGYLIRFGCFPDLVACNTILFWLFIFRRMGTIKK